ncbi:MAG: GTP cyclohydrolase I FolE [Peptococcaceae bacterium]|nr:GTP cyclohydrolase I FolE [Peptococcaceae bacterium]
MAIDTAKIETAVTMILEAIGEDPEREGLRATPARVARFYAEAFSGLTENGDEALVTQFTEGHEEMIIVKDIPFYSMCEHHLLPFVGIAHVAYIPRKGRISGLSKLVRVIESFSRRPQLQERLTTQIADSIERTLDARGVLVVLEAEHMCMTVRGVKKPGAKTLTSAVRGTLETNATTRAEAFSLIRGR